MALVSILIRTRPHAGVFTSDGNIDADGNPVAVDYDPGYGGVWNFNDLDSGVRLGEDTVTPVAVYATWVPTAVAHMGERRAVHGQRNGARAARLQLGQIDNIDQTASPGFDSPVPGDRPWKLLGVYDVSVGDTLTVTLSYDTADGGQDSTHYSPLCISDVMIHPLWPTVSIRATNVTVNPNAPRTPRTTAIGSMPAKRSTRRWMARATACRFNCKRRSTRFTRRSKISPT